MTAATTSLGRRQGRSHKRKPGGRLATTILLLGAAYAILPSFWVLCAATKTPGELFTSFSLWPSFHGGFTQNFTGLFNYEDGRYLRWALNSLIYAGGGTVASVTVSALAGYGLAKYKFIGRSVMFNTLLAGVLIPGITLAIPQYLLLAKVGLAGSYWSVLLPSVLSPYGIYLCRIYADAAVSDDLLEAGRLDGASEWRMFRSIAAPVMVPGLITVFLVQFVASWNNFLLPFIMLSDDHKFPITVGLYSLLHQGANQPALYNLVIMGVFLSIIPLIVLFLLLQRFWQSDLLSGAVKG